MKNPNFYWSSLAFTILFFIVSVLPAMGAALTPGEQAAINFLNSCEQIGSTTDNMLLKCPSYTPEYQQEEQSEQFDGNGSMFQTPSQGIPGNEGGH